MAHHKHFHRRRNPFAAGSVNKLAIKVAGALGGAVGAASIPSMLSPRLNAGWGGVGLALVVAFGASYLLKGMSMDLAEGVLIGGSVQAVSRAITIVTGVHGPVWSFELHHTDPGVSAAIPGDRRFRVENIRRDNWRAGRCRNHGQGADVQQVGLLGHSRTKVGQCPTF